MAANDAKGAIIFAKRKMVRVDRIELTQPAWKAGVLPLNYTRDRIECPNIDWNGVASSPFRRDGMECAIFFLSS